MIDASGVINVVRCPECHGTFLAPRRRCPRCGSAAVEPGQIPATGVVLAATELWAPAEGFPTPHRLVLVECAELLRVLGWTEKALPATGVSVAVVLVRDAFRMDPLPVPD